MTKGEYARWFAQVKEIEVAIQERLDRIKAEGSVGGELVVFALGRCINTILAEYSKEKRAQVAAPLCDFIEKPQVDRDAESKLISPVEGNLISGATQAFARGKQFRKH